jgi:hypothetical protein
VTLAFTLAGAYFPNGEPFEAKRLDVEIRMDLGGVRFSPFRIPLTGVVRADGLVEAAVASGTLRVTPSGAEYSLEFVTEGTRQVKLSFSLSLTRVTVRSLTELTGAIAEGGTGTLLGRARLRLDVRSVLGL